MQVEHNKIEEIANRLRQFEQDGNTRYFSIAYTSNDYKKPQQSGGERLTGERAFRGRINEVLYQTNANKIIVKEYKQRARNVKTPENEVEIIINREGGQAQQGQPQDDKSQPGSQSEEIRRIQEALGNVVSMMGQKEISKQEGRSEAEKDFQLEQEKQEKRKLQEENEGLRKENEELHAHNEKLLDTNDELTVEVERLQKYIPENYQIGNFKPTKILGAVLGTATETLISNFVATKPHVVEALLGKELGSQIAGLMGAGNENAQPANGPETDNRAAQGFQQLSEEDEEKQEVVQSLYEINASATMEQLEDIKLLYYLFLREDGTINGEKLQSIAASIREQANA